MKRLLVFLSVLFPLLALAQFVPGGPRANPTKYFPGRTMTYGVNSANQLHGDMGIVYGTNNASTIPTFAATNTLYVRTNGNDATAILGNVSLPWATFGAAVSNAPAGSVVNIGPGSYYEANPVWMPQHVAVVGTAGHRVDFGASMVGGHVDGALTIFNDNQFYNANFNLTNGYAWIMVSTMSGPDGTDAPATNVVFNGCTIQGRSDNFMLIFGFDSVTAIAVPCSLLVTNCALTSGWDFFANLYWISARSSLTVTHCTMTGNTRLQRGPDYPPLDDIYFPHHFGDAIPGYQEWSDLAVTVNAEATNVILMSIAAPANRTEVWRNISFDVLGNPAPGNIFTPINYLDTYNANPYGDLTLENVSWKTNGGSWYVVGAGSDTPTTLYGSALFTGTLRANEIVAGTLTAANATLHGTFTGDGSGLTGLVASSTNPVPSYVVTNRGSGYTVGGTFSSGGTHPITLTNTPAGGALYGLDADNDFHSLLQWESTDGTVVFGPPVAFADTISGNGAGLTNVAATLVNSGVTDGFGLSQVTLGVDGGLSILDSGGVTVATITTGGDAEFTGGVSSSGGFNGDGSALTNISQIMGGAVGITFSDNTEKFAPWQGSFTSGGETLASSSIPLAGSISRAYFNAGTAPGSGTNFTFKIYTNGTFCGITSVLASGQTVTNDLSNVARSLPAGTLVSVGIKSSYNGAHSAVYFKWSFVFAN